MSVRPYCGVHPSRPTLQFLQWDDKMALIKVAWYVSRVKNMHPWSPSDPSGTAAAEAKPRCVYSILKPHSQSFITSPESVQSSCVCEHTQDVPKSGYFLVTNISSSINYTQILLKSMVLPLYQTTFLLFRPQLKQTNKKRFFMHSWKSIYTCIKVFSWNVICFDALSGW